MFGTIAVGFELHTLHHSREQNRSSKPTQCPRPNWPQKMESSGIPSSLLDLDWFCKKLIIIPNYKVETMMTIDYT